MGWPRVGVCAEVDGAAMRLTTPAMLLAQAPAPAEEAQTPGPVPAAGEEADAPTAAAETPAAPAPAEAAPTAEAPVAPQPAEGAPPTAPQPAPWPPEPQGEQFTMSADRIYYYGGAAALQGNVVVKYKGYTITADTAEIDADRVWGQFRGKVTITAEHYQTTVERLRVNFDTDEWTLDGVRTVVAPEYFERGVAEPIYIRSGTVEAEPGGETAHIRDALVTTCDLDHPHYGLTSPHATLREDGKVVLRRPALELFGQTIFRYPWNLVLDTNQRNNRFFPEFGQNSVEGFFAKVAYLYLAGDLGEGFFRLHLTQRRGVGLGADHSFAGSHRGQVSLFYEPQQGAFSVRGRDDYDFSDRFSSAINLSLQNNSGYEAATTSLASNWSLRYRGEDFTTALSFDHSLTDSAYSSARRFTTNFSHQQRFSDQGNWNLRAIMLRSDYGNTTRSTLDADFQISDRYDAFDWALAADRTWDLEGTQGGYGVDRLPELVVNTDSRRLGDLELLGFIPFRATLRTGQLLQYPEGDRIAMASLDTQLGGESVRWGPSTFRLGGRFQQGFYSDGSARYAVGLTSNLDTEYGGGWVTRLSYSYAGTHGYSPLRSEYAGTYDELTYQIVRQGGQRSRLELAGGYDFHDHRHREARLRAYWAITDRDRIEVSAGRAFEEGIWRPIRARWIHAGTNPTYLALSSYYDLARGQLSNAEVELDWRLGSKWRIEALGSYSGYTNDFDQLNLRLTRDLHCWVASLTYNLALNELRLNLGIKAFPSEDQAWSLGGGGQRLGSYYQSYY